MSQSKYYQTDPAVGLTTAEAQDRLQLFGPNQISATPRRSPLSSFLRGFLNPLSLILLFMAVGLFLLRDYIEAALVIGMVLVSVILDFWQEYRADQAVEKLQARVATFAEVMRDGRCQELPVQLLVPGDILLLNAGDIIAADGVILTAKDFFINQANLTGESLPIEKTAPTPAQLAQFLDHAQQSTADQDLTSLFLVFNGTNVDSGTATVLVTRTGARTQFSQIAASLEKPEPPNQFALGMIAFSKLMLKLIAVVIFGIFLLYGLTGHDWLSTLTFSVATAVGIAPDFLVVIMSLCLSYGAQKMAKKGVIVKKMVAMPNFGSTQILCTDKTGTLTQDKITLVKHTGIYGRNDDDVLFFAQLNSQFQGGLTNAMDQTVLNHYIDDLTAYEKIEEIPYDFNRRALSVIVAQKHTQQRTLIMKGAPETILPLLTHYHHQGKTKKITATVRAELDLQYQLLSADGFRVLAIACKKLNSPPARATPTSPITYSQADEKDLTIYGFISFLDPVKPDVQQAIQELRQINIEVKVITGDSVVVARQICSAAGIPVANILTGDEVARLSDQELARIAPQVSLFARFSPLQKERVIIALKKTGQTVAYLGDGINDAPSLRAADVGISVDNAADVAREAADIILTHKSLAALEMGVLEGRKTFVNTMKYVRIGMASSVGNVLSLIIAAFALPFLPLLPIQVLLNDFLYDMSQLTLASDHVDDQQVTHPQQWDLREMWRFMLIFGPLSSVFDLLLFWAMYAVLHLDATQFQTTWFIYSVITQMLGLFIMRTPHPLRHSHPSRPLIATCAAMALTGVVIALSPLGRLFDFSTALTPFLLLLCLVNVLLYLTALEIAKHFYYRRAPVPAPESNEDQ